LTQDQISARLSGYSNTCVLIVPAELDDLVLTRYRIGEALKSDQSSYDKYVGDIGVPDSALSLPCVAAPIGEVAQYARTALDAAGVPRRVYVRAEDGTFRSLA
jgi:hypothetical protein